MADRILYPNATEYFRTIHHNLISNAFMRRKSFVMLPSLYQRAYILTHQTGELPVTENFVAPDESLTERESEIDIITGV